jgi:hypothetical protein
MGVTNHMARMGCATDVHLFSDYGIFTLFKFTFSDPFVFGLFCSLDLGIHCYCLEKRGKDKYITVNQSLDGTATSSAPFFMCCGAARQYNR